MYTNFEDLSPLIVPTSRRYSYLQLRIRMGVNVQQVAEVIGCSVEEYEILEGCSLSEISGFELHAISSMTNSLAEHLPIINTEYTFANKYNQLLVTQERTLKQQELRISNAAACNESVSRILCAFWVLYLSASGESPNDSYVKKFASLKGSDVEMWAVKSQIVKAERTAEMPCEVWLETCTSGQVLASFLPESLNYDDEGFSERYFVLCVLKYGNELVAACEAFLSSGAKRLGRSHIELLLQVFKEHRRICRLRAPW